MTSVSRPTTHEPRAFIISKIAPSSPCRRQSERQPVLVNSLSIHLHWNLLHIVANSCLPSHWQWQSENTPTQSQRWSVQVSAMLTMEVGRYLYQLRLARQHPLSRHLWLLS